MAKIAKTVSVTTSSTSFDIGDSVLTEPHDMINLTNLDSTNPVWLNWMGGAASAEGDDCVPVRAGESIQIRKTIAFTGIAVGGTVKLNVWIINEN